MADRSWLELVLRRQLARVAADAANTGAVSGPAIDRAARRVLAAVDDEAPMPPEIFTRGQAADIAEAADHREALAAEAELVYGTLTAGGHGRNRPKQEGPSTS